MRKVIFLVLAAGLSLSATAQDFQQGRFVSEEGCVLEVFNSLEGEAWSFIISSPEGHEPYTSDRVRVSHDLAGADGPALCGDTDDGMPASEVVYANGILEIGCGGFWDLINYSMMISFDEKGAATSLELEGYIATFSIGPGVGSPQPKTLKAKLTCSDFVLEEKFQD